MATPLGACVAGRRGEAETGSQMSTVMCRHRLPRLLPLLRLGRPSAGGHVAGRSATSCREVEHVGLIKPADDRSVDVYKSRTSLTRRGTPNRRNPSARSTEPEYAQPYHTTRVLHVIQTRAVEALLAPCEAPPVCHPGERGVEVWRATTSPKSFLLRSSATERTSPRFGDGRRILPPAMDKWLDSEVVHAKNRALRREVFRPIRHGLHWTTTDWKRSSRSLPRSPVGTGSTPRYPILPPSTPDHRRRLQVERGRRPRTW